MSKLSTQLPRRKPGSARATRAVSLARLKPVIDPYTRCGAGRRDPDEFPPPCASCRGFSTLWFVDRRTGLPKLICLDCTPHQPTNDLPETDVPHAEVA